MTAPTLTVIDPTGLRGERVMLDETKAPAIVEMYAYPSHLSLESIRRAWVDTMPIGSCTAVIEFRVSAGRRFCQVTYFRREAEKRLRIDEPNV